MPTSLTNPAQTLVADEFIVVDTLSDRLADDGETSLREALLLANSDPNVTEVTFDESLLGGTLLLEQGSLEIASDVIIDGDGAYRGANSITIDGGRTVSTLFEIGDATVRLEDLSVNRARIEALSVERSDLHLDRVMIDDVLGIYDDYSSTGAWGIHASDSRLSVENSVIRGIEPGQAGAGSFGVQAKNSEIQFSRSVIDNVSGEYAHGIQTSGTLIVEESLIHDVNGYVDTAIAVSGELIITDSRIEDAGSIEIGTWPHPETEATIVNTAFTGNRGGIYANENASLEIGNSTITGNGEDYGKVSGDVTSLGNNIFEHQPGFDLAPGDVVASASPQQLAEEPVVWEPAPTEPVPAEAVAPEEVEPEGTGDAGAHYQIRFLMAEAANHNSFGWYLINDDGSISNVQLLDADLCDTTEGTVYDLGWIEKGQEFGMFIAVNGGAKSDAIAEYGLGLNGSLGLIDRRSGDDATIDANGPTRLTTDIDGQIQAIKGVPVFHVTNLGQSLDALNVGGAQQARSAINEAGNTVIAFEDIVCAGGPRFGRSDHDFDDAVFELIELPDMSSLPDGFDVG